VVVWVLVVVHGELALTWLVVSSCRGGGGGLGGCWHCGCLCSPGLVFSLALSDDVAGWVGGC